MFPAVLVHANAHAVPSAAFAQPIRHCPHGALVVIIPITAAALSAAAARLVTSVIVHAAAGADGLLVQPKAHVCLPAASDVDCEQLTRHCAHCGALVNKLVTYAVGSGALPAPRICSIVHDCRRLDCLPQLLSGKHVSHAPFAPLHAAKGPSVFMMPPEQTGAS